jgi:superfamily II DNA or RNA helicase
VIFNFNTLIKGELDSHQVEGVKYALNHHYHLNCDEMGLGKTLCALTVAFFHQRNKHFPVLILVPSYLALNWKREIEKFARSNKEIWHVPTGKKAWHYMSLEKKPDFCIISYDLFRAHSGIMDGYKMVIADEVHYLKNPEAKITIEVHDNLDLYRPDVFIGLTGTPIKNRVPEFYSPLCLSHYNPRKSSGTSVLDKYSYGQFKDEFCWREEVKVSRYRKVTKHTGFKNKDKLLPLLEGKYIRRTSETLNLIEPKHIEVVASFKEDKELQAQWDSFNSGIKESVNSSVKKMSAIKTAPFTAELCNDLKASDNGPIVIFSCHPDANLEIQKGLVGRAERIDGATSNSLRDKYVQQFQAGEIDFLLITLAGSTGITLTSSHVMVFNDEDWVPENNSQVRGRIYRRGQGKRCLFYYVRGSKTASIIGATLLEKSTTIREVLSES